MYSGIFNQAPQLKYLKNILIEELLKLNLTYQDKSIKLQKSDIKFQIWRTLFTRYLMFSIDIKIDEKCRIEILELIKKKSILYKFVLLNSKA